MTLKGIDRYNTVNGSERIKDKVFNKLKTKL